MTKGLITVRRFLAFFLENMVIALMSGLAILVVVAVGFRKAGAALVWYDEVAAIMLAWLTYYGAALAALRRAHIGFPRGPKLLPIRWQGAVRTMRTGIVVAFFMLTAWAGWRVLQVIGGSFLGKFAVGTTHRGAIGDSHWCRVVRDRGTVEQGWIGTACNGR